MKRIALECEQCKKLINELRDCTEPTRVRELVALIDAVTGEDNGIPNLAFNNSEEHNIAASYVDELVCTPSGHFRHYYICMCGYDKPYGPCMHMITSKNWKRLFDTDAWQKGQTWYCDINSRQKRHRYMGKFGVIVEIRQGTEIFHCRAEVPDQDKHDLIAMQYEKKYGKGLSAKDLYERIPVVNPTVNDLVIPVAPEEGVYKISSYEAYLSLPELKWDAIYNLA